MNKYMLSATLDNIFLNSDKPTYLYYRSLERLATYYGVADGDDILKKELTSMRFLSNKLKAYEEERHKECNYLATTICETIEELEKLHIDRLRELVKEKALAKGHFDIR